MLKAFRVLSQPRRAAFLRYYLRNPEKKLTNLFPPVIGFFVCSLLWLNLSTPAKIAGSIWMGVGIAYGIWKTKGFKEESVDFEVPAEE
jgi:predicted RND superfamily exporter protein